MQADPRKSVNKCKSVQGDEYCVNTDTAFFYVPMPLLIPFDGQ